MREKMSSVSDLDFNGLGLEVCGRSSWKWFFEFAGRFSFVVNWF